MINKIKPYVSFVVVGRNDNYGHNFLGRFQNFLSNLTYLCEKNKLPSELIVVEWNPPKEEKKLYEVLNFDFSNFLNVRFIEVPKKVHESIPNKKNCKLREYYGKNVGIRRSKGEFILVTNPDIIFSDEMIKLLAKRNLKKDVVYRSSRYDLGKDIPQEVKKEKLLKFCKDNWNFEWNMRYGMSPRGIKKIKYFPRMFARFSFPYFLKKYLPYKYHGGAPGDFTLLHKKVWEEIKAYPELDVNTLMDFYAVIMAVAKFGKIKRLKEKIYHQFHERGGVGADFQAYLRDSRKMLKTKKIISYNKDDWGLKNKKLKEKVIN